jgi:hypothetical protein
MRGVVMSFISYSCHHIRMDGVIRTSPDH